MSLFAYFTNQRVDPEVGTGDTAQGGQAPKGWRGFRQRMTVSRRGSRLLVLTCLMVSIWGFSYTSKVEQLHAQFQFRQLSMNSVSGINLRIRNYAHVLVGMGAYIAAAPQIDVEKIEEYVTGLNLERNAPGLQGFAFIRAVPVQDVTLIQRAPGSDAGMVLSVNERDQGGNTFIVTQIAGEVGRDQSVALDIFSEADVRAALEVARRSRETVLVRSKAMLVRAELLMIHAVYGTGAGEGDGVFAGWIMTPFSFESILGGALPKLDRSMM